ncbi:hypothetical protein B0H16DRAFT_1882998 [Mycena metata]|uniref:BTB domain-containing protein n=1 Tax=Mycena metata TaxID=1033252 RepID=A0AAD7NLP8_9AGAR|nr:hypothetical protein B0H16DRAFT_1882998 [Mycena metata]
MSQAELKQADGLWFPADVIILRAEGIIFRVPKSILGARSVVFQGMFELPQPAADGDAGMENETMDGIPVVHLHDSAKDVDVFLRAIFDSSYFMPPPSPVDINVVLGILRLSHKYDVKYLFRRAIDHLETICPIGLSKLEDMCTGGGSVTNYLSLASSLGVLPIFHRLGVTWLLPYACYKIGTHWVKALLEFGPAWDTLPQDMKQTCLCLPMVQAEGTGLLYEALTPFSACASPDSCNLSKFKLLKARPQPEDIENQDPLIEVANMIDLYADLNLCDTCAADARERYHAVRADIWNKLPANCGLEEWDVLLEQRRLALE